MNRPVPRHRADPLRAARHDRRQRRSGRVVLRSIALSCGVVLASVVSVAAFAFWGTSGAGAGSADTSTLGAASSVNAAASVSTVTLTWTAAVPPSGASLTGYYVTRWSGSSPADACGTTPSSTGTYLAGVATGCSDTAVPNGSYTYSVTAVFATWTAESLSSNAIVVNADGTAPTMSLASSSATNAYLGGSTLFFRPSVAGSVRFALTVSDGQSGPASATFPAIGTTGWTHAGETVTTGTGSVPSITYTSSPYSWTPSPSTPSVQSLVGTDAHGNNSTIPVTFTPDASAPTGGALTVNAVVATGVGSTSVNKSGIFTIGSRVDYTSDTGSGVASSVLTRETATLVNGTCGAYGAATVLVGSPGQSGLTTGCHRFTLTGTDRVGNATSISTVVRVDLVAPSQAFSLVSPVGAAINGTRVYFRGTVAGSFSLAAAVTDAESGPASTTFPVIGTTGWTHNVETVSVGTGSAPTVTYTSTPYSWTAAPSIPGTKNVISSDLATNTVTTGLVFTRDNTAPTGGVLSVNGVTATAAGNTSNNATGAFVIGTRTDWIEVQSTTAAGLASSVLTREAATLAAGVCGTYGSATVLTGAPAQSGLTTGCYRFVLTGTDNVGNTVTRTTTVRVDTSAPVGAVLTVNGTGASAAGTTSQNGTGSWTIGVRTDWTDPEWATTTSTLTRATATIAKGVCGTFGGTTTLVGTPAQVGTSRNCYRYTLTGTNTTGLVSTITTIVKVDPYVTNVQLLNGPGIAGRATAGDTIVLTFSDTLDTSTLCSAWSGTGNQSITGDSQLTVSLNNAGTDTMTMTSTLCTLNVGTLSLGSAAYTTATTTFGGFGVNKSTLTWDASSKTLTVVLGTASSASPATVASSIVTYTPSTALRNGGGLAMGGSFATLAVQQF